jgi:hypothetical protein
LSEIRPGLRLDQSVMIGRKRAAKVDPDPSRGEFFSGLFTAGGLGETPRNKAIKRTVGISHRRTHRD